MPGSSEEIPEFGAKEAPPQMKADRPHPLVGEIISERYRVMGLIAVGGMSSVYLGQHVHMRKHVAIKVLDPKAARLPELVARFQREAIAGAHVRHPNIASAADFGQLTDGSYFLVLEHVPGVTLDRLTAGKGPLPAERAVKIVRQLASALGAGHDVGVVHRDVKPTNVMILEEPSDMVKLIDFGFARVRLAQVPTIAPLPDESAIPERILTAAGVVVGTVAYMAPEAALGMAEVDHRSDLYATGLILYELLAGAHPFDATDPVQLFLQQRTVPPPPFAQRSPAISVPLALEAVVMRLLEKDPKNRPQSAGELVLALDSAMMSMAFALLPEVPEALAGVGLFDVPAPPTQDAPVAILPASDGGASKSPGRSWRKSLLAALPREGIFPEWAYVGLPAVAVVFAFALLLLLLRSKHKTTESAFEAPLPARSDAEDVPAEPREVTLEIGGQGGAEWRLNLRNAARQKEWAKGADAVRALIGVDPAAFHDRDVQTATRNVAVGLEQDGGENSDKFFSALVNDSGQLGLDLLFDISRFRPATKAGRWATEILRQPEIAAKASTPLRVLIDFRDASCGGKRDLFPRMAEQGDDRALWELGILKDAECPRRRDPCCFKESRALAGSIRSMKARLGSASSAVSTLPAGSSSGAPSSLAPPADSSN